MISTNFICLDIGKCGKVAKYVKFLLVGIECDYNFYSQLGMQVMFYPREYDWKSYVPHSDESQRLLQVFLIIPFAFWLIHKVMPM